MLETLVAVAVSLLVLTAAIHSLLGERRLITPLMRERTGVLASAQYRFLLRLTWHLGSALSLEFFWRRSGGRRPYCGSR